MQTLYYAMQTGSYGEDLWRPIYSTQSLDGLERPYFQRPIFCRDIKTDPYTELFSEEPTIMEHTSKQKKGGGRPRPPSNHLLTEDSNYLGFLWITLAYCPPILIQQILEVFMKIIQDKYKNHHYTRHYACYISYHKKT